MNKVAKSLTLCKVVFGTLCQVERKLPVEGLVVVVYSSRVYIYKPLIPSFPSTLHNNTLHNVRFMYQEVRNAISNKYTLYRLTIGF